MTRFPLLFGETGSKRTLVSLYATEFFVFLLSTLGLLYNIIFLYYFETLHSTTSYFPWAWQVVYTNAGTVYLYAGIFIFLSVLAAALSITAALSYLRVIKSRRAAESSAVPVRA